MYDSMLIKIFESIYCWLEGFIMLTFIDIQSYEINRGYLKVMCEILEKC